METHRATGLSFEQRGETLCEDFSRCIDDSLRFAILRGAAAEFGFSRGVARKTDV